jgi:hypothetical protein
MDHDDHIEGDDAFPDDDENADQESVQYGLFDDPAHDPIDQEDGKLSRYGKGCTFFSFLISLPCASRRLRWR